MVNTPIRNISMENKDIRNSFFKKSIAVLLISIQIGNNNILNHIKNMLKPSQESIILFQDIIVLWLFNHPILDVN